MTRFQSPENRNLWQETATDSITATHLTADTEADLVIIGGGFTGCSAALHAAELGLSVRLLEAKTIGYGGSGRNVGLVNAGLWLTPDEVISKLGLAAGEKLNSALATAPALVYSLIERHQIACEPKRAGTLQCANTAAGVRKLIDRHQQLKAQNAPVRLLGEAETSARTGSQAFFAALHDARAGTIQPLSYCRGLARAAQAAGASLHQGTKVSSVSQNGSYWEVKTTRATVRANALLVATNAYHDRVAGLKSPSAIPVNYFQMATKPLADNLLKTILPAGEGCWDTASVLSSFRLDAEGRVIIGAIGGLGHVGRDVHCAWASRKLAEIFPQLAQQALDYAWHGKMAMTSDHIPKILKIGPNGYVSFGYSGRGIGPATLFGILIADSIIKQDRSLLPVAAVRGHSEPFSAVKMAYYEIGATLTHLFGARPG